MISSACRRLGQRVLWHVQASEQSLLPLQRAKAQHLEPCPAATLAEPSVRCRSLASSPPTTPATPSSSPPLSPGQLVYARRILRRRRTEPESSQRYRNLKVFKKEAQTGTHDVKLPVYRWVDLLTNYTSYPEAAVTTGTVLRGSVFNRPVNRMLLHQVVRWQRARRRQPIACTKTKAEVRGGGRKPHHQKGSGRARQGSTRSPHMRGGGVTFGPKPRSFAFQLPKKIRRAGLMAALSSKTQQNSLLLIDTFTLSQEDAQHCLRHKILDMAGRLKDLETYFVPQKLQRERFYNAIVGDETLLQDEELNARNDDTIADNILQRAIENKEPLVPLFMNTSAFKESLFKLLPPAIRDERLTAAENILSTLNAHMPTIPTGSSIDKSVTDNPKLLKMFQTPADTSDPKKRLDRVLVIHSDTGEDCGPIERDKGKYRGLPIPVDAIQLENTMLRRFTANLRNVNCLPARGANVMDILRHKYLVITEAGVQDLTLRLTRPMNRGFKPAGYDWQKLKAEQALQVAQEKERRESLAEWIRSRGAPLQ